MAQTSVKEVTAQAYEGKLENKAQEIKTGIAGELIYFGKAVGKDKADLAVVPEVNLLADGDIFEGVAVADPSVEAISSAAGGYVETTSVNVIKKGKVWVKVTDAITDLSVGVFVKNANGSGVSDGSLGSFNSVTGADYIELSAVASVKWAAATTVDSDNYGLLSINEG